ncbi:C/D box methylation guide ribonucleoprotein complex aNOP56 subunit [Vulcanisaeta souniana]|uniref:Pre-mRNA processing ribonucleoprotein,-binding region n=1 Tax=Vulcanisaeta souniana JCM 11219 TaxID=1293586 RepID=A0A830E8V2_9CREN|nr:C/D box methylation guide ribonucleoprotein complex aNOP56 subunit [Vulcanisaeta souniana]BDR92555.1 pre-mRNA processing ribonucleoprotein,-binding region [Vulcanisaeta souniana JCM 11219]GGI82980.1 pre-mRNA processing ribonucleoprotein,-binding region [Vulcanisaeta souniana JCM 11219]
MSVAYLVLDVLGVVALNENGDVIAKVLYEGSTDEIADKMNRLGAGEPIDEIIKMINELKDKGVTKVIVENRELARNLTNRVTGIEIRSELPSKLGTLYRGNISKYIKEIFGLNEDQYLARVYEITSIQTRHKLRQVAEKRDLFIAQAISSVDDLDKILNLISSRVREWYGLHFPELEDLVKDHGEYMTLITELGHRSNFTIDNLVKLGLSQDRAKRISEAAGKSVGAEMADWDLEPVRTYAKIYVQLSDLRNKLSQYIDEALIEVAPNIRELVGPLLGARLLMLAGGLMRLALLPASTIQVLGAEKALFRALRTGGRPPKHGIIFQFPEIFRAPRWQRGKIARALAAKLAIAAKADAFTGNFIAPRLKEDLMKRIQEVKTLYAKPPPRKPEAKAVKKAPEKRGPAKKAEEKRPHEKRGGRR